MNSKKIVSLEKQSPAQELQQKVNKEEADIARRLNISLSDAENPTVKPNTTITKLLKSLGFKAATSMFPQWLRSIERLQIKHFSAGPNPHGTFQVSLTIYKENVEVNAHQLKVEKVGKNYTEESGHVALDAIECRLSFVFTTYPFINSSVTIKNNRTGKALNSHVPFPGKPWTFKFVDSNGNAFPSSPTIRRAYLGETELIGIAAQLNNFNNLAFVYRESKLVPGGLKIFDKDDFARLTNDPMAGFLFFIKDLVAKHGRSKKGPISNHQTQISWQGFSTALKKLLESKLTVNEKHGPKMNKLKASMLKKLDLPPLPDSLKQFLGKSSENVVQGFIEFVEKTGIFKANTVLEIIPQNIRFEFGLQDPQNRYSPLVLLGPIQISLKDPTGNFEICFRYINQTFSITLLPLSPRVNLFTLKSLMSLIGIDTKNWSGDDQKYKALFDSVHCSNIYIHLGMTRVPRTDKKGNTFQFQLLANFDGGLTVPEHAVPFINTSKSDISFNVNVGYASQTGLRASGRVDVLTGHHHTIISIPEAYRSASLSITKRRDVPNNGQGFVSQLKDKANNADLGALKDILVAILTPFERLKLDKFYLDGTGRISLEVNDPTHVPGSTAGADINDKPEGFIRIHRFRVSHQSMIGASNTDMECNLSIGRVDLFFDITREARTLEDGTRSSRWEYATSIYGDTPLTDLMPFLETFKDDNALAGIVRNIKFSDLHVSGVVDEHSHQLKLTMGKFFEFEYHKSSTDAPPPVESKTNTATKHHVSFKLDVKQALLGLLEDGPESDLLYTINDIVSTFYVSFDWEKTSGKQVQNQPDSGRQGQNKPDYKLYFHGSVDCTKIPVLQDILKTTLNCELRLDKTDGQTEYTFIISANGDIKLPGITLKQPRLEYSSARKSFEVNNVTITNPLSLIAGPQEDAVASLSVSKTGKSYAVNGSLTFNINIGHLVGPVLGHIPGSDSVQRALNNIVVNNDMTVSLVGKDFTAYSLSYLTSAHDSANEADAPPPHISGQYAIVLATYFRKTKEGKGGAIALSFDKAQLAKLVGKDFADVVQTFLPVDTFNVILYSGLGTHFDFRSLYFRLPAPVSGSNTEAGQLDAQTKKPEYLAKDSAEYAAFMDNTFIPTQDLVLDKRGLIAAAKVCLSNNPGLAHLLEFIGVKDANLSAFVMAGEHPKLQFHLDTVLALGGKVGDIGLKLDLKLELNPPQGVISGEVTFKIPGNSELWCVYAAGAVSPTGLRFDMQLCNDVTFKIGDNLRMTVREPAVALGVSFTSLMPLFGLVAEVFFINSKSNAHLMVATAMLINCAQPAESVFSVAISRTSIPDTLKVFCPELVDALPKPVVEFLSKIKISDQEVAKVQADPNLLKAFEDHDSDVVSSRLNATMGAGMKEYAIEAFKGGDAMRVNTFQEGSSWEVVDVAHKLKRFMVERHGSSLRVALMTQVYVAPKTCYVGKYTFEQGIFVAIALEFFGQRLFTMMEVDKHKMLFMLKAHLNFPVGKHRFKADVSFKFLLADSGSIIDLKFSWWIIHDAQLTIEFTSSDSKALIIAKTAAYLVVKLAEAALKFVGEAIGKAAKAVAKAFEDLGEAAMQALGSAGNFLLGQSSDMKQMKKDIDELKKITAENKQNIYENQKKIEQNTRDIKATNERINAIAEQTDEKIKSLRKEIADLREDVDAKLIEQKQELIAMLKAQKEELVAQLNAVKEELMGKIDETNKHVDALHEELKNNTKDLNEKIEVLRADFTADMQRLKSQMNERFKRVDTQIARLAEGQLKIRMMLENSPLAILKHYYNQFAERIIPDDDLAANILLNIPPQVKVLFQNLMGIDEISGGLHDSDSVSLFRDMVTGLKGIQPVRPYAFHLSVKILEELRVIFTQAITMVKWAELQLQDKSIPTVFLIGDPDLQPYFINNASEDSKSPIEILSELGYLDAIEPLPAPGAKKLKSDEATTVPATASLPALPPVSGFVTNKIDDTSLDTFTDELDRFINKGYIPEGVTEQEKENYRPEEDLFYLLKNYRQKAHDVNAGSDENPKQAFFPEPKLLGLAMSTIFNEVVQLNIIDKNGQLNTKRKRFFSEFENLEQEKANRDKAMERLNTKLEKNLASSGLSPDDKAKLESKTFDSLDTLIANTLIYDMKKSGKMDDLNRMTHVGAADLMVGRATSFQNKNQNAANIEEHILFDRIAAHIKQIFLANFPENALINNPVELIVTSLFIQHLRKLGLINNKNETIDISEKNPMANLDISSFIIEASKASSLTTEAASSLTAEIRTNLQKLWEENKSERIYLMDVHKAILPLINHWKAQDIKQTGAHPMQQYFQHILPLLQTQTFGKTHNINVPEPHLIAFSLIITFLQQHGILDANLNFIDNAGIHENIKALDFSRLFLQSRVYKFQRLAMNKVKANLNNIQGSGKPISLQLLYKACGPFIRLWANGLQSMDVKQQQTDHHEFIKPRIAEIMHHIHLNPLAADDILSADIPLNMKIEGQAVNDVLTSMILGLLRSKKFIDEENKLTFKGTSLEAFAEELNLADMFITEGDAKRATLIDKVTENLFDLLSNKTSHTLDISNLFFTIKPVIDAWQADLQMSEILTPVWALPKASQEKMEAIQHKKRLELRVLKIIASIEQNSTPEKLISLLMENGLIDESGQAFPQSETENMPTKISDTFAYLLLHGSGDEDNYVKTMIREANKLLAILNTHAHKQVPPHDLKLFSQKLNAKIRPGKTPTLNAGVQKCEAYESELSTLIDAGTSHVESLAPDELQVFDELNILEKSYTINSSQLEKLWQLTVNPTEKTDPTKAEPKKAAYKEANPQKMGHKEADHQKTSPNEWVHETLSNLRKICAEGLIFDEALLTAIVEAAHAGENFTENMLKTKQFSADLQKYRSLIVAQIIKSEENGKKITPYTFLSVAHAMCEDWKNFFESHNLIGSDWAISDSLKGKTDKSSLAYPVENMAIRQKMELLFRESLAFSSISTAQFKAWYQAIENEMAWIKAFSQNIVLFKNTGQGYIEPTTPGSMDWNNVPSLPNNIVSILEADCPFEQNGTSSDDESVHTHQPLLTYQTHKLVYVPHAKGNRWYLVYAKNQALNLESKQPEQQSEPVSGIPAPVDNMPTYLTQFSDTEKQIFAYAFKDEHKVNPTYYARMFDNTSIEYMHHLDVHDHDEAAKVFKKKQQENLE